MSRMIDTNYGKKLGKIMNTWDHEQKVYVMNDDLTFSEGYFDKKQSELILNKSLKALNGKVNDYSYVLKYFNDYVTQNREKYAFLDTNNFIVIYDVKKDKSTNMSVKNVFRTKKDRMNAYNDRLKKYAKTIKHDLGQYIDGLHVLIKAAKHLRCDYVENPVVIDKDTQSQIELINNLEDELHNIKEQ